jgi:hypothetical protein
MTSAHKPSHDLSDTQELLLGYLDYYRSVIECKLEGLSGTELRSSRLPSDGRRSNLLKHLVYMERWFRWGFTARQLDAPFGDFAGDNRERAWHVDPGETCPL